MHNSVFKVGNYPEFFEVWRVSYHLFLNCQVLVIFIIVYFEWKFISVMVQIDETIVQEESMIALFAIWVIHLVTSLNIFRCLNNKASSIISIGPCCLSWSSMIKHVSISNEAISLNAFYLNTKDSTGDHHSDFRVFLNRELFIVRHLFAYEIIVSLYVFYFFMDLFQERAALKPQLFFLCEENWEVCERLR